jgi:hypothetical protein
MTTQLLADRLRDQLDGVLNCFDRIVLVGSLHPLCYPKGLTHYFAEHRLRVFDFAQFAQPLTDLIRATAERLARESGLEIDFIGKKNFRKEDRIQTILKSRGTHPGLVHIFSALEPCDSFKPWHDKQTHHTYFRWESAKCLHYYFYLIDPDLGLVYLRVQTWCPFRLQFYFNGHAWLATQLRQKGIGFELIDNAFVHIDDYEAANQLVEQFDPLQVHRRLDQLARQFCPVIESLNLSYTWSIYQAEYATDLVFKRQSHLQAFYSRLVETLIHTVKPEDIATFLGRKLNGNYLGEMGNRFNVRILGTRIKHVMGPVSIKAYDKFGLILRIEVTVNDVSFFQQYREVRHLTGETEMTYAPMKKTLYSLPPLAEQLKAATRRYLEFLSAIATPEVGVQRLNGLAETQVENARRYKGFNLFTEADAALMRLLLRGEFAISGLTARALRLLLPEKSSGQISRLIKRLRVHHLLRKVGRRYKYYLTQYGRDVATMALKLRELYVIPSLAA